MNRRDLEDSYDPNGVTIYRLSCLKSRRGIISIRHIQSNDKAKYAADFSDLAEENVVVHSSYREAASMSKIVGTTFMLIVSAGYLNADVHIIEEMHADSYYYQGVTHPEVDRSTELWIGNNMLSQSVGYMHVIVDRKSDLLTIINHDDSTYVQCPIPFDWSMIVPEDFAQRLNLYHVQGTYVGKGETRDIRGRKCMCNEFESWILVEDNRYYPAEWKSWVTTELPVDWQSFSGMYRVLLQLANFQSDFLEELAAIQGYPLLIERKVYLKGFSRDEVVRVTEFSEQEPPPDTYGVPTGYTEKDYLSPQELGSL